MTARRRIERYTHNRQDDGAAPPDLNTEIVKNRRHFLANEVAELQARVAKQEEMAQLSSDRASC